MYQGFGESSRHLSPSLVLRTAAAGLQSGSLDFMVQSQEMQAAATTMPGIAVDRIQVSLISKSIASSRSCQGVGLYVLSAQRPIIITNCTWVCRRINVKRRATLNAEVEEVQVSVSGLTSDSFGNCRRSSELLASIDHSMSSMVFISCARVTAQRR